MNFVDAIPNAGQPLSGASAPVPPEKMAQQRELIQAVKAVNAAGLFGQNNELTYVLDPQTHRAILRIINRNTQEVIDQIPPEYLLRLAASLKGQPYQE